MDAAGARALARRIETEGGRPTAARAASPPAPPSSWRERVPRPLRRSGFSRRAVEDWTASASASASASAPAREAAEEPARIVIRRLERPAGDGRGLLTFLERERRVTVEGREAVVTELVCRKRVDGRWETVVVDARIAYRRG
jgi:hypothetical protein